MYLHLGQRSIGKYHQPTDQERANSLLNLLYEVYEFLSISISISICIYICLYIANTFVTVFVRAKRAPPEADRRCARSGHNVGHEPKTQDWDHDAAVSRR